MDRRGGGNDTLQLVVALVIVVLMMTWCLCPWRLRALGVRLGLAEPLYKHAKPKGARRVAKRQNDDDDNDDAALEPSRCAPLFCRCMCPERGWIASFVGLSQRACCCACVVATLILGASVALMLVQLYTTHNGDLDALKTALRTRVAQSEL